MQQIKDAQMPEDATDIHRCQRMQQMKDTQMPEDATDKR